MLSNFIFSLCMVNFSAFSESWVRETNGREGVRAGGMERRAESKTILGIFESLLFVGTDYQVHLQYQKAHRLSGLIIAKFLSPEI
jgi:hypothetical protein